MLTFTNFLENATTGALPLKPFERTFQGLIFADTYLGHCYPSPRSYNVLPAAGHTRTYGKTIKVLYSDSNNASMLFLRHLIRHPASAENVEMQMGNGLARVRTAIGNYAISA